MAYSDQTRRLSGSLVALVTPMHPDGSIDWEALDKLVDWHADSGTHGIVAVGTTGESATLDVDEHSQVIARVIARAAGRLPVIAGTGANSTREAIELTEVARKLGADAALLVTPYYNKPTQEGLYQHYRKLAESVDIPQMLYNVPGRTSVDLLNATAARLADIPNITSIKDATGDLVRGQELVQLTKGKLDVFSGDDATAHQLIAMGARGNVSVTANIAPALMAQLCEAALQQNAAEMQRIDALLQPIHAVMFCESNPIPVKWALSAVGRIAAGIRLPLTPLAAEYQPQVRQALLDSGMLGA